MYVVVDLSRETVLGGYPVMPDCQDAHTCDDVEQAGDHVADHWSEHPRCVPGKTLKVYELVEVPAEQYMQQVGIRIAEMKQAIQGELL